MRIQYSCTVLFVINLKSLLLFKKNLLSKCRVSLLSIYGVSVYVCECILLSSVQFGSVIQSCQTLCNPMDCRTPGLHIYHQLPEFTQTHVHWVGDAIQPSHPLLSFSPPAFNLSKYQGFSNESALQIGWPKYWHFSFICPSNEHSGLISFRMDWLNLLAFQGLSWVVWNTTVQKHQFFSTQLSL